MLHCNDPNWAGGDDSIAAVETSGNVGWYTSLELDASGFPVVSYWDAANRNVTVLHCGNANCTSGNSITSPDAGSAYGNVGVWTSLAVDISGNPLVSYSCLGGLRVLHSGNANCTSGNSMTSPDASGYGGERTWLALDALGNAVGGYYDVTNMDVKVRVFPRPTDTKTLVPDNGLYPTKHLVAVPLSVTRMVTRDYPSAG